MAHRLTCLLASWLAGIGRHETDGVHHLRPFLVVICAARLAEVMLLEVTHFVHQSGEALLGRALAKVYRVECDLRRQPSGRYIIRSARLRFVGRHRLTVHARTDEAAVAECGEGAWRR